MQTTEQGPAMMIEVERLVKAAIEAAYKDGWHDGYNSGLTDGHPLSSSSAGVDESWDESDSKETIDKSL